MKAQMMQLNSHHRLHTTTDIDSSLKDSERAGKGGGQSSKRISSPASGMFFFSSKLFYSTKAYLQLHDLCLVVVYCTISISNTSCPTSTTILQQPTLVSATSDNDNNNHIPQQRPHTTMTTGARDATSPWRVFCIAQTTTSRLWPPPPPSNHHNNDKRGPRCTMHLGFLSFSFLFV
jgi:hypothetical protein